MTSDGLPVVSRRGGATDRLLLICVSVAVGLSLLGQQLITPLGESRRYLESQGDWVGYGFALLALAGLLLAVAVRLVRGAADDPQQVASVVGAPSSVLLGVAVVCVLVSSVLVFVDGESSLAIYPWGLGLVLMVMSCWDRRRMSGERLPRREIVFLGGTLVVAFCLRFWDLASIPPEVHGDEAACGLEARRILRGEVPNLLGIGWYDISYLSFAISAAFMALFGDDLYGLRTASVFQGVASVAVLHLLVRRLYGPRVAGVAALLLALSNWHIHFSRIGTDYMQASFATLLALLFLVRARQHGRLFDWALTGLGVGFALSVYHAGRVVLVMLAALLMLEWLVDRGAVQRSAVQRSAVQRSSQGLAMLAVAVVLFVAPTVMVLARWPQSVAGRSQDVFVLSERNLRHTYASTQVDDIPHVLALQLQRSLVAFNWRGERSAQHGHGAPLLDFWSGAIFAAGLLGFTLSGWHARHRLLAIWFWSNFLLGSVLTVDAMFSPRMIVALPSVFVFAALVVDLVWTTATRVFGRAGNRGGFVLVALFIVLSAFANVDDYFRLHVREMQPAGPATRMAHAIREINDDYRVYVLGRYRLGYDTLRFLVPEVDGADLGERLPELPLRDAAREKGVAFIVDASWEGRNMARDAITEAYPQAARSTIHRGGGRGAFDVYSVDPADLGR